MFWAIVLGGCVAAAIVALMRGQNPLAWGLSSIPGAFLLGLIPPAKGRLGEQNRARREVGDKLGYATSGAMVILIVILAIVGVI